MRHGLFVGRKQRVVDWVQLHAVVSCSDHAHVVARRYQGDDQLGPYQTVLLDGAPPKVLGAGILHVAEDALHVRAKAVDGVPIRRSPVVNLVELGHLFGQRYPKAVLSAAPRRLLTWLQTK